MSINTLQLLILKMRRTAAIASLTFGVVLLLGVVGAQLLQAQTFTTLHDFTGGKDGANPWVGLVQDSAGNLYGTTYSGGANGYGTVFKVSKNGKETVMHSFAGGSSDGSYSYGQVIVDSAGNLYGATYEGGSFNYGVVFKLSKAGKETVLYNFKGGTADGCNPAGGLLRDKAGNLYGTTGYCGIANVGTIFKVSKTGKETVLHSFAGAPSDGAYPAFTSPIMDTKGDLYGVTEDGGTDGQGTVYALTSGGNLTLLHSFAGGTADGCYPLGTPAMDSAGNLYSTAEGCGASSLGMVWKVSRKGTETTLHTFTGTSSDGGSPLSGLSLDAMGNLYGDTEVGGASGQGAVYELPKKGKLIVLHSFDGSGGANPFGGVLRDANGNMYGTTVDGGSDNDGTVWKLAR